MIIIDYNLLNKVGIHKSFQIQINPVVNWKLVRNKLFAQCQSSPCKILINYKEEGEELTDWHTIIKWLKSSLPVILQIENMLPDAWEEYSITLGVAFRKMHVLNLIMRKFQTSPNRRTFYLVRLSVFKNAKKLKLRERLRLFPRVRKTERTWQLNAMHDSK